MKRSRLRCVSKKQSEKLKIYYGLREDYLRKHPRCEVSFPLDFPLHEMPNCQNKPDQIHHTRGRGKFLNETITWMAICRNCHRWLHDNPSLARELGFIKT